MHSGSTAFGRIRREAGVTGVIDNDIQTVTVTIADMSLFAPPSFWSLTVERRDFGISDTHRGHEP